MSRTLSSRSTLPIATLLLIVGFAAYHGSTTLLGQAEPQPQPKPQQPPPVPKELTSYRDIVKRMLPAVVSIEAKVRGKAIAPNRQQDGPNDRTPPGDNVGFGSGFIIDPKGVILTNYHVVEGAESVEVFLQDGRRFTTKDIKGDKRADLAIVRLSLKENVPFLELGDSDEMEVGDRVLAIGAPFGLTGSVTHGIISAKSRNLRGTGYEDFLQTDAAINPGNSGGPLINLEGKVIGINTAIKSRSGGFQGVGLAITSNVAKNIASQLVKEGIVRRGYLGVQINELEPKQAELLGVKDGSGVVISRVFEGSPAGKSGLKAGDVVTKINGKALKSVADMQRIIANVPLNTALDVSFYRDAQELQAKLTITEQPNDFGVATGPAPQLPDRRGGAYFEKLGMRLTDVTPEALGKLGFREAPVGVFVSALDVGGVAYKAGLRDGSVITQVNRQGVDSIRAFTEALGKASLQEGILLRVESVASGTEFIVLQQ